MCGQQEKTAFAYSERYQAQCACDQRAQTARAIARQGHGKGVLLHRESRREIELAST
ncbi:MAG: hypothetical protein IPM27_12060 [Nitrosomonadales bacterium]|nr:hypothetical protein [Nitrosomonadales bacterium]